MSEQNATGHSVGKRNDPPKDASGIGARRSGLAFWLRKHLLNVGGIVGAVVALLTLPGLILSTWNGSWRLIDSWTEPSIAVSVGRLNLRCLVDTAVGDSQQPTLESNCDPGNIAVSGKFVLINQDRVARNLTSLRGLIRLIGASSDPHLEIALRRPLSVRHEVVNGAKTVAWFDWMPVGLDPQSTRVQEIAFDQLGNDSTKWKAIRKKLFPDDENPAWHGIVFSLWAMVFGETEELKVLHCVARFKEEHLNAGRQNKDKQTQIPFDCKTELTVGLAKS